jgi:hypothetical protein
MAAATALGALVAATATAQSTIRPNALGANAGYGERGDVLVLTTDGRLVRVPQDAPAAVQYDVPINSLGAGETLVGIDVRPANGQAYGVSDASKVYVLDPGTGRASLVSTLSQPISGTSFGVDFNPVADRLRVVSNNGQNLRIEVETGVTTVDSTLGYAAGDRNEGTDPTVVAAAYTENRTGATTTQLYDIDTALDVLALQDPPNNGVLRTVGWLGVDADAVTGFDILKGKAFAAIGTGTSSRLYRIDLETGEATNRGRIGGGAAAADITLLPGKARTLFALAADGDLLRFDRSNLRRVIQRRITGLGSERLVGIDFRPANGQLIGVSSRSRIYRIDARSGAATLLVTMSVKLDGTRFGVDFNPTVDRLRIVSNRGQNLRVNVADGSTTTDGSLWFADDDVSAGDTPQVSAAGYRNNVVGGGSTTLFDIDAASDSLVVQDPPNDGVLTTVGDLGIDIDRQTGFDVSADGWAVAALDPAGRAPMGLYRINLSTGRARFLGTIAGGPVRGITFAPRGGYLLP